MNGAARVRLSGRAKLLLREAEVRALLGRLRGVGLVGLWHRCLSLYHSEWLNRTALLLYSLFNLVALEHSLALFSLGRYLEEQTLDHLSLLIPQGHEDTLPSTGFSPAGLWPQPRRHWLNMHHHHPFFRGNFYL